jgi:O-antigen/teichoic acid export membrane protein
MLERADKESQVKRAGVAPGSSLWARKSPENINWQPTGNLFVTSSRGGMYSLWGSWLKFALQLATTVIVARILGPSEYGIGAIVGVFAGVAELIRDSGSNTLIVQRRTLSSNIVSSLNLVNISVSLLAAIALCAVGPLLAELFGDWRYLYFAPLLGLVFVFSGAAAVPAALLARNLELRRLAVLDVVSVVAGCAVGLLAAVVGLGANSLVFQALTFTVLQSVLVIFWCPWRPGRLASRREVRKYVVHVSSISSVKVLNYAAAKVDNLVAGVFVSTRDAGLYNQAFQLMVLPLTLINGPVQRVFVPAMSKLVHGPDQDETRMFYRGTISVITSLLWPLFAVLTIYSEDVILLLFGRGWIGSAEIFGFLVVAGAAQTLGYVNTWLYFATGEAKRNTVWTFVSRPIMMAAFVFGVQWGISGLALALTVVSALEVLPGYLIVRRKARLMVSDLFRPLLWPTVLAAIGAGLSVVVKALMPPNGEIGILLVNLSLVGVGMVLCAFLIAPIRNQVTTFSRFLRPSGAA